jgi:hypothetical protein
MEQTTVYINDTIGLQELESSGRLWRIPCEGNHLEFTDEYFIDVVIGPFLNVTFPSV